ncbi:MAG: UPF0149 family protein [Paracoccaceae bacterium]
MDAIDLLEDYLNSGHGPEGCMGLSDLDGFLTGLACFPEPIPEAEWLDTALGDASRVPAEVIDLIRHRVEEIRDALDTQSAPIEPVFWQAKEGHVIAMDWCEGFLDAVKLRPDRWDAFVQTDKGGELMLPIMVHIFDENGNSMLGLPQEEIDETLDSAAAAIPSAVPAIHRQLRIVTRN